MSGIVMGPVQNRRFAGIMDHFAADFDAIAGPHGNARCDIDVVDDLDRPLRGTERELLVFALRTRPEEETRLSHNGPGEIGHARHLLRTSITHSGEENKRSCE
jgi:hypothetical protein